MNYFNKQAKWKKITIFTFLKTQNRLFMSLAVDSHKILKEIDTLGYIEKLHLLSYITRDLIKSGVKTNHNLAELKGLGKEIWQSRNIDSYIQNERASWD